MCSRPNEKDGNLFACRTCDECISNRRHQWVARAMAEKAMYSHSAVIALTYSDETEIGRQGARMFCYADVRDFLKRLRSAAAYKAEQERWNETPVVRFLCAGEQGDRNGRCHWHLVLFTNFDLAQLGEFRLRGKLVSHPSDLLTVGKRKRRLNWSLWPWGFMTMQEPDQGGMNYVLSYCLKDQFTEEKSKNTMREAKSENFATGLFRMSKRPAIGDAWLYQKLSEYLDNGAVPPALQLKVPDFHGFWQPHGDFRKKLLWGLVALNQRIKWATGADAPQWPSLLASLKDMEKDLEVLNGKEQEIEETSIDHELAVRQRQLVGELQRADLARKCGGVLPCYDCLHALDDDALASLGLARKYDSDGAWDAVWEAYTEADGSKIAKARWRERGKGPNPYCRKRGSREIRLAFPETGGET